MNECLASWPNHSIEQITKLSLNEISDILVMVLDVVLKNLGQNNAYSTLILESSS